MGFGGTFRKTWRRQMRWKSYRLVFGTLEVHSDSDITRKFFIALQYSKLIF